MPATVTRYVVTYINSRGQRTLCHPQQGRHTYATHAEAQQWIDDAKRANSLDKLNSIFVDHLTMEVRPVACWPGHFDPTTCWFA